MISQQQVSPHHLHHHNTSLFIVFILRYEWHKIIRWGQLEPKEEILKKILLDGCRSPIKAPPADHLHFLFIHSSSFYYYACSAVQQDSSSFL